MNQQQIHDRIGALNAEISKSMNKARDLETMKQKAERKQLADSCVASGGHVMVHSDYPLNFGHARRCAVCGLPESGKNDQVSANLTKER